MVRGVLGGFLRCVAEAQDGAYELRRYYQLGFMPLGFFSRLIVKLYHRDIGVVEAWREGALIQVFW
jgi:hypothetical protein